ncbi:MAG: hypothetical protein K940chlam7_00218 [Chlamydiae bacterium]|nr:hypothetical protein [Chlamydiota bacterium]
MNNVTQPINVGGSSSFQAGDCQRDKQRKETHNADAIAQSSFSSHSQKTQFQGLSASETELLLSLSMAHPQELQSLPPETVNNINRLISQVLRCVTMNTIKFKTRTDGTFLLTFKFKRWGEEEAFLFDDKRTMIDWLAEKKIAKGWEILERSGEKVNTSYLLRKKGSYGFDYMDNKEAFYDMLSIGRGYGHLWKTFNISTDEEIFICLRKRGLLGRIFYSKSHFYEEVEFKNLMFIASQLELSIK